MKIKKFTPSIVLISLVILAVVGYAGYTKLIQPRIWEDQKLREIKELTEKSFDPAYAQHGSQKRNEVRERLCLLTARSSEEREEAVIAIRDFLEMPTTEVSYECNDTFYSLEEDKLIPAKGETYTVGLTYFIVDPETNHVLQVEETPGTWGYKTDGSRWFSESKEYDCSANYSKEEVEQIARSFIAKHTTALGDIDLSELILETGKKDGGNGRVNYFFIWRGEARTVQHNPPLETCSEDLNKDIEGLYYNDNGVPCIKRYESTEVPTLSIAFTNGGQLISFSNELNGPVSRATVR
ncbi:hypothetical protein KKG52_04040 [Patescibacteria group bacterium]|nr:hypothetical protein [Patescibacteria group bacterium]